MLSSSKNRYHLDGEIDVAMCREQGFNQEVINRFRDGFPLFWKDVLLKYRTNESDANNNISSTVPPVQPEITAPGKNLYIVFVCLFMCRRSYG